MTTTASIINQNLPSSVDLSDYEIGLIEITDKEKLQEYHKFRFEINKCSGQKDFLERKNTIDQDVYDKVATYRLV